MVVDGLTAPLNLLFIFKVLLLIKYVPELNYPEILLF
jgi:hypothetical protein